MKKALTRIVLCLLIVAPTLVGCKLLGPNASAPGKFETNFFTLSNAVIQRIVTVTNTVPVFTTNQVTQLVTITNAVGVPVTQTNIVTVIQTNLVTSLALQTNNVIVPQLVPGTGSNVTTGVVGAVANAFGVGGIASTVLAGLFAAYLRARNNALAGTADAATQTSAVLAQNVQTIMSVLTATPQGQALLPGVKNYLLTHQVAAGVVSGVADALKQVDPLAAQGSAQAILDALARLQGPAVATTDKPIAKVA